MIGTLVDVCIYAYGVSNLATLVVSRYRQKESLLQSCHVWRVFVFIYLFYIDLIKTEWL